MEPTAHRAFKAMSAQQEQRVLLVLRERKAFRAFKARRGQQVLRERKASKVLRVTRARQVRRVLMVQTEPTGRTARKAFRVM
jgi:hypothetical protein